MAAFTSNVSEWRDDLRKAPASPAGHSDPIRRHDSLRGPENREVVADETGNYTHLGFTQERTSVTAAFPQDSPGAPTRDHDPVLIGAALK